MRRRFVFILLVCWIVMPGITIADQIQTSPTPASRSISGEVASYTSSITDGWVYIWYDADFDDAPQEDEVETALFQEDGVFHSSHRYYPGMSLVIEVHADSHYARQFNADVPWVDSSAGDPPPLGLFQVLPMKTALSNFSMYGNGADLTVQYPIVLSGERMMLDILADVDMNDHVAVGTDPYMSVADGAEYAGTTCVIRTSSYAFVPDEMYDWFYSDPSYLYYAYRIGERNVERSSLTHLISLEFLWQSPDDIEFSIYFCDGSWHSPEYQFSEIYLRSPAVTFRTKNTTDGYVLQHIASPEWRPRMATMYWLSGSEPTDTGNDPWVDEGDIADPDIYFDFFNLRTPQGIILFLALAAAIAFKMKIIGIGPRTKKRPTVIEDSFEPQESVRDDTYSRIQAPITEDDMEPDEEESDVPQIHTKPKLTIDPTGARIWILRCAACGASMDIESIQTGFLGPYCRCEHCGATNIVEVDD